MTLKEIKDSEQLFLNAADVAPVLGCDPNYIRIAARQNPEQLGFPVVVLGRRVRIPRKRFLEFFGEERTE